MTRGPDRQRRRIRDLDQHLLLRAANQNEVVRINVDIVEQVAPTFAGFISAAVHRSTDGTRVIDYLQWESHDHLAAMQRSSEFQAIARRFAGLIEFDPHECEVVHVAERGPRPAG